MFILQKLFELNGIRIEVWGLRPIVMINGARCDGSLSRCVHRIPPEMLEHLPRLPLPHVWGAYKSLALSPKENLV